jgi:hypothetical protein
MRLGSEIFDLSHVVETRAFVGVDSVTAFAKGTIAEEKSAAINESSVIFLNMILLSYWFKMKFINRKGNWCAEDVNQQHIVMRRQ